MWSPVSLFPVLISFVDLQRTRLSFFSLQKILLIQNEEPSGAPQQTNNKCSLSRS